MTDNTYKFQFVNIGEIKRKSSRAMKARRAGVAERFNAGQTPEEIARDMGGYSVDLIRDDLQAMGVSV